MNPQINKALTAAYKKALKDPSTSPEMLRTYHAILTEMNQMPEVPAAEINTDQFAKQDDYDYLKTVIAEIQKEVANVKNILNLKTFFNKKDK